MFSSAEVFNHNIGNWDVSSSVTNMPYTFKGAYAFNQDISGWNVSSVVDMDGMIIFTEVFNQDIGGWNVSSVINMEVMFAYAIAFNQDIGNWDVRQLGCEQRYQYGGHVRFRRCFQSRHR